MSNNNNWDDILFGGSRFRDVYQEAGYMEESREHRRHPHKNRAGEHVDPSTCQELADLIRGMVISTSPCVVMRLRNINATILGRRTRSPLALPFALSFEDDLNLGETVILQREINPFMSALRKRGIIVTALHNHWLFDRPRLMYMHWEDTGDAFDFAERSFAAAKEAGLFKNRSSHD